jgi:hypothetical protein
MVTRSRRRGDRPRHAVTVEEPGTEAYLRAELKVRIHSPPAASPRTIGSATVFLLWVSDSLALYARVAVKAIGEVTSPLDLLLSEVKPPT